MPEIKIQKTTAPKAKPDESALGFGKHFTDHMFVMEYTKADGWHNARIIPFDNFTLHPAATVFHYGAEVFEGMKAYRRADGTVQMFRPIENVRRMNNSAERISLPQIDEDFFMEILEKFVELEQDWVPSSAGTSLYLRPFMFGADPFLGLHTIDRSIFAIIASPVGSYYKEGINPVKIIIEEEDVRAVRGGTGYAKCGGNYAASNRAGERAQAKGFSQVLWLDGVERKYIEEVGAMNVMFRLEDEIVTPELTGSVLPGITRKSILELLREKGYKVNERPFSVDELVDAIENGKLIEAWGCGTAAVVSPIGQLTYKGKDYIVNGGKIGDITQEMYDTLTGIQWGNVEDTHNWTYPVKKN